MAKAKAAPADDVQEDAAAQTPTPDEARAMFEERPDLAGVLTTEGFLHRDGTLAPF